MRNVLRDFKNKGYYLLSNGEKLYSNDFHKVYVAGGSLPLIWDFNNLYTKDELELKDVNSDSIYETTLIMNPQNKGNDLEAQWKLSKDISAFPQYKSTYPISDAIYNLSLEEMQKAIEKDSTLRTGKEWAGVWTRDVSYSTILSMAYMQPKVAMKSLMRKVSNGRIVQDTGTGGAYPVSSDRMIWAVAAWEIYKVTGDMNWLKTVFPIIKKSLEDDYLNIYDSETGLVRGESSFLDWREQTYPRWMQPADIYLSENIGTNAVHYQANIVLSYMATLLNDKTTAEKSKKTAERIKKSINRYFWIKEKSYFGQYRYGRIYQSLSPRAEALGEALSVWFNIVDKNRQKQLISSVPVLDFGIPCIYPQIPNIPPYHNNAIWPFVQSYWALAATKTGNEASVMASIADIYRATAFFLTNKENFVAQTGDYAGTQINSSNMLWSLSGNIALVQKILFGAQFDENSIRFQPFVPEALKGARSLTNFKYRDAVLNIEMTGFGNKIKSFELDGAEHANIIPDDLTGIHTVKIILANNKLTNENINTVENEVSIETPVLWLKDNELTWNKIDGAISYIVLKNGKEWRKTTENKLNIKTPYLTEYQVVAINKNNIQSFASEPVISVENSNVITLQVEDYYPNFEKKYTGYQSKGYVETSTKINATIEIPVTVTQDGWYAVIVRYANGNGPINTENKCAIRTLKVDGRYDGTFVFPQRGTNEWSNWGYSNSCKVQLTKGTHQISILYEPQNENMNININQALIDEIKLYQLK